MRYRIWLLVLLVAMGLACTKPREQVSDTDDPMVADTATPPPSFTLKVTFEGLVGYVNTRDAVWALLPRALHSTLPPGHDPHPSILKKDFPEHYAFLKVDGANVKGFGIPGVIYIPITGKEIWVTDAFPLDKGIPSGLFKQAAGDPADKLEPTVLTSDYSKLAARVKLPLLPSEGDWLLDEHEANGQPKMFVTVSPTYTGSYCEAADFQNPTEPRVQAVTWQKTISGEVTLKLQGLDGTTLPGLTLAPVNGQPILQVSIVNQVGDALHNPMHGGKHWPAYRWFYNLSVLNKPEHCPQHYYPQGELGGNRCPQKLFRE